MIENMFDNKDVIFASSHKIVRIKAFGKVYQLYEIASKQSRPDQYDQKFMVEIKKTSL